MSYFYKSLYQEERIISRQNLIEYLETLYLSPMQNCVSIVKQDSLAS